MAGKNSALEVYEGVRRDILDGRRLPRARLRMDLLSVAFDASLGAVRCALVRLAADGLVVADPPRGFAVASISLSDLDDLTGTRIELETRCLSRSIELGDIAWEGRVISSLHQLLRTPLHSDQGALSPDWVKAHRAFHDALVSASDSAWRLRLRDQLFVQAERYRRFTAPDRRGARDLASEHRAIAEAALARDAVAASEHMAAHLRLTAELLRKSDAPFDDAFDRGAAGATGSETAELATMPR
jgi:DNA-binding GntR family transcriptional regulator